MSAQTQISEARKARMGVYHNPYLFLELEEASDDRIGNSPASERNSLARFHNPYIFEDADLDKDQSLIFAKAATSSCPASYDSTVLDSQLAELFDDVLRLYRPFVGNNQWAQVLEYRPEFLREARREENRSQKVADGLRRLKFQLKPGEKVEFNRAPAERIIGELKRLLY